MEKPKTQKETIDQLWYAVIGTNGHGLTARMAHVEEKIDAHLGKGHAKNGKQPKRLEVLATIVGILIGLQTLGFVDGIRAAIFQWLAGPPTIEAPSEPE